MKHTSEIVTALRDLLTAIDDADAHWPRDIAPEARESARDLGVKAYAAACKGDGSGAAEYLRSAAEIEAEHVGEYVVGYAESVQFAEDLAWLAAEAEHAEILAGQHWEWQNSR